MEKDAEPKAKYGSILAVNLGSHNVAITVCSTEPKPIFYGKDIKEVRGHYFWLRRHLPNRSTVRKVGRHERHIVDSILHRISKGIVSQAERNNSLIVLGNLKGT